MSRRGGYARERCELLPNSAKRYHTIRGDVKFECSSVSAGRRRSITPKENTSPNRLHSDNPRPPLYRGCRRVLFWAATTPSREPGLQWRRPLDVFSRAHLLLDIPSASCPRTSARARILPPALEQRAAHR